MFGSLRVIRGICGFLFAIQIVHLIEAIPLLLKSEGGSLGAGLALALIKVIALVVFGFLFFWLRGFINRLHLKKHGVMHPALAGKKWAL